MFTTGLTLAEVEEREHEAGLGNGGLGRLAACFLTAVQPRFARHRLRTLSIRDVCHASKTDFRLRN